MIAVVSLLWRNPAYRFGERYGADHVNRMTRMLRRHLTVPHRHVCLCDDPSGIETETLPLWPEARRYGGAWPKVKLFSRDMASLVGPRFLYIDLDAVIVGNIDALATVAADFATVECRHPETHYCSALMAMDSGARERVWTEFAADPVAAVKRTALSGMLGWDQAWASLVLGPGETTFGPRDGVLNFTQHLADSDGALPDSARLVLFNGRHDPSQRDLWRRHPWIETSWA